MKWGNGLRGGRRHRDIGLIENLRVGYDVNVTVWMTPCVEPVRGDACPLTNIHTIKMVDNRVASR